MRVKTALQLINRFLAEDDFDHDTQFCLAWFEQLGWATGRFGEADVLARAKGTSVNGLQVSGVVESSAGNLRLLRWTEIPKDWTPEGDARTPVWEALHQLIRALNQDGESAAGALWQGCQRALNRSAHWHTGSTHCANVRAGPKHAPTTSWCRRGLALNKHRRKRASKARKRNWTFDWGVDDESQTVA